MAAAAGLGVTKPAIISAPVFRRMLRWRAEHPEATEQHVACHRPMAQFPCHIIRLRRLKPGKALPPFLARCEMPAYLFQPTITVDGTVTSLEWA